MEVTSWLSGHTAAAQPSHSLFLKAVGGSPTPHLVTLPLPPHSFLLPPPVLLLIHNDPKQLPDCKIPIFLVGRCVFNNWRVGRSWLICSVCQWLWCKYPQLDRRQNSKHTLLMASQNPENVKNGQGLLSLQKGSSTPQLPKWRRVTVNVIVFLLFPLGEKLERNGPSGLWMRMFSGDEIWKGLPLTFDLANPPLPSNVHFHSALFRNLLWFSWPLWAHFDVYEFIPNFATLQTLVFCTETLVLCSSIIKEYLFSVFSG